MKASDRPTFLLRLRPERGVDPVRALRVCPKTSGGITKFSEHEAD